MTDFQPAALWQRLRPHAGKLAFALVGFLLGALIFSGTPGPDSDAGHDHAGGDRADPASDEATIWTCSMHPQIRQPEPGQCPICGMDLIPVTTGSASGAEGDASGRVVLSERARALARLRTTPVRRRSDAASSLRLLGRVEPDETTFRSVTAWTGGRIDRLHVSTTGERVRAGQVVATLYSPEVFAAHQDLLVARRQVERLSGSPESSRRAAEAALGAARERLSLLGVPDDELSRLEKSERPTRAVPIRTPFAGTVLERVATEGAYVVTGAPLYRLANLRTVWLQLDAYESDLSRLEKGQRVLVRVDALPGEDFEGKVAFIDPTLDSRRRTLRVRVEVPNADRRLRPGMFAAAIVLAQSGADEGGPLVVPASAPLFTGRRALVYVEVPDGEGVAYEPRNVRLGPRLNDYYPVVAGLSEGERVVSRGAFAVDADLQIRGAPSMMTSADDRSRSGGATALDLPRSQRERLAPVVEHYLELQRALAADDLQAATTAALDLERAVASVTVESPAEAAAVWPELSQVLRAHAHHAATASDLEGARAGFEQLSAGVSRLLSQFGNPLDSPLSLAYCPMARGNEGASWIQQGTKIDNSYFGASMRSCGEVRQQVAPGSHLSPGEKTGESAAAPAAPGGHGH